MNSKECEKCCYPLENCRCAGKAKGKTFTVRLVDKVGHPWEHRIVGTDKCIALNDTKGPTLHLTCGHYYLFDVDMSDGSSFFFTTDPMGAGPSDPSSWKPPVLPGAPGPAQSGIVCLKVTKDMPRIFYYNNDKHSCMGGICTIHSN